MTKVLSPLDERLADKGVSRRDFLKFCGAVAAMLGLSELAVPQIAAAVQGAAAGKLAPAVWLDGGLCTGCTESTAQSENPDVAAIVLDILSGPLHSPSSRRLSGSTAVCARAARSRRLKARTPTSPPSFSTSCR